MREKRALELVVCWFLALVVVAMLVAIGAQGQSINMNGQAGPVKQVRGVLWSQATNTNVLFFTWTPANVVATPWACVSISNNNPTNAHTATFTGAITQDPFANPTNVTRWNNAFSSGANTINVSAAGVSGSTATISFPIGGAAQAEFSLSLAGPLAGTPDTFDVTVTDSPYPCYFSSFLPGSIIPRPCALAQVFTAATATITLVQVVPSNQASSLGRWHICAFNFSGAASTTAANLAIGVGDTASTCATISQTFWAYNPGVGIPNSSLNGSPEVFSATGNRALCFQNVGTGTTAQLSINFDYW